MATDPEPPTPSTQYPARKPGSWAPKMSLRRQQGKGKSLGVILCLEPALPSSSSLVVLVKSLTGSETVSLSVKWGKNASVAGWLSRC